MAQAEAPLRTCRTCGTVERNRHHRCSNCGRDYGADPPRFSRRAKLLAAGVAAGVVVVGLAIALPIVLSEKDAKQKQTAARDRAAIAREAARLRRNQTPVPGRLAGGAAHGVPGRKARVVALQTVITADAQGRARDGRLKGAARTTLCGPLQRVTRGTRQVNAGEEVDPGIRIARYDCIAVLRNVVKDGKVVAHYGHPYVATLDFSTGGYVFCQAYPSQSERGPALAMVQLPRACVNAHGEPLKGGYVTDPRDPREPLPILARAGARS